MSSSRCSSGGRGCFGPDTLDYYMGTSGPQALGLPDGDVVFYPSFFPQAEADRLLQELLTTTAWRQECIKLYGKPVDVPRLTAWYGEEGTAYTYSGIVNEPQPWTPALLEIKRPVEVMARVTFNSVLLRAQGKCPRAAQRRILADTGAVQRCLPLPKSPRSSARLP